MFGDNNSYYARNKERVRELARARYIANRERYLEQRRLQRAMRKHAYDPDFKAKFYAEHKERIIAQKQEYYLKNREKIHAAIQEYIAQHRPKA